METQMLDKNEDEKFEKLVAPQAAPRIYEIIYLNVIYLTYVNMAAIYGLWFYVPLASWQTLVFNSLVTIASWLGITAGVHRLWTHKSYKAKLPMQILLILFNSMAGQLSAIKWARDHRMHHKYSDTDADPYNATRGLFYSQIGWVMVKKHTEFKKRVKFMDLTDLYSNPLLVFQFKYTGLILVPACFILPTIVPVYFWNESFSVAWHMNIIRYAFVIHEAGLVNSLAHSSGYKPYDKHIAPCNNILVSALAAGEGFHNYQHVFPTDYRTAELGNNMFNITTIFIDFCAWIGWAHDLKTAPDAVIAARCKRTGDGTDLWGRPKAKGREMRNSRQ